MLGRQLTDRSEGGRTDAGADRPGRVPCRRWACPSSETLDVGLDAFDFWDGEVGLPGFRNRPAEIDAGDLGMRVQMWAWHSSMGMEVIENSPRRRPHCRAIRRGYESDGEHTWEEPGSLMPEGRECIRHFDILELSTGRNAKESMIRKKPGFLKKPLGELR